MTSTTSSSAVTTAAEVKVCFNSFCKQPLEHPRRGWRCRTGDFAELCDRCCSAYEESKFCESFHLNASGWRCCETCGKQIHCGCIGSFHLFVLLDAGGIECITCTRKSFILTPNPAWPPPSLFIPLQSETNNNRPLKEWSPIAGSGPVPWRQAPSLFNGVFTKTTLRAKRPREIDVLGGADNPRLSDRLSASLHERKGKEDSHDLLINGSPNPVVSEVFENGDEGFKRNNQTNAVLSSPYKASFTKDSSTPNINLTIDSSPKTELISHANISTPITRPPPSPLVGKQTCNHNGVDTSGETQPRNGKARVDVRPRNDVLPRYWPRITDQELQQISGDTNSVITPLFEKVLSVSDAGRIGRLVLPKKCAETYLPPIFLPEGLPLKMKDVNGNEWDFQFRFWPNNNSRMYVLEGVTPCIQSMHLQAGDIVTFSRIEPEGKFIMGGRKASTPPSDQGNEAVTNGDGVSVNWDVCSKSTKDAKEISGAKLSIGVKRKNSTLSSKSKRLRIENKDMVELEVTWKEIQGIIRPPPNYLPRVMAIEDYEIEEYEGHEPIIGRPTIPATDDQGGKIQWVQCEDCFKWRKMPANTLLPSRWTCSLNVSDQERSVCSAAQECTKEQLEALLPTPTVSKGAAAKKKRTSKQSPDSVETLEGIGAIANLAIKEDGASSQATTRHPRHKPGCACIVCMQPPSGVGKHKQPCECIVCQSVKRRFRRMMAKRHEKQLLGNDAGPLFQNLQADANDFLSCELGTCPNHDVAGEGSGSLDDSNVLEFSASPLKSRIDLNIQPEREEETSPGTAVNILPFLHDSTETHRKEQKQSCSGGGGVYE